MYAAYSIINDNGGYSDRNDEDGREWRLVKKKTSYALRWRSWLLGGKRWFRAADAFLTGVSLKDTAQRPLAGRVTPGRQRASQSMESVTVVVIAVFVEYLYFIASKLSAYSKRLRIIDYRLSNILYGGVRVLETGNLAP